MSETASLDLAAELFPETVGPLGSLRWCLAALRRALGWSDCLVGDSVEAYLPGDFDVDLWHLDDPRFDLDAAGPLLGNRDVRCNPEFATWLLVERERFAGLLEARIRQDTIRAMSIENHDVAIRLAELGVRRNPFDERAHVLLVKSLALAGRTEAAGRHAEATERLFLAELGERPSQALRSAARPTIAAPPSGISQDVFVGSLIQSGLAALAAGAVDAGLDCLRRAASDAERIKGGHLLAKATLELGTTLVHAVRGYDDEGAVLLQRCTELARQCGDAGIAATSLREPGYVEALAGRRPSAARHLSDALDLVVEPCVLSGIHGVMAFNLIDWGRLDAGLEHHGYSLELACKAGNRRREAWTLGLGGWGLLRAGRSWNACSRSVASCRIPAGKPPWPASSG